MFSKNNRFIDFLGGRNIIFALVLFILIGILIFIFDKVSFVFSPFIIILKTVIGPIILAFVIYYLLNPVVNFMERYHITRLWAIIILLVLIIGGIVLAAVLLIPLIEKQLMGFGRQLPEYTHYLLDRIKMLSNNSIVGPYVSSIQDWMTDNITKLQTKVTEYAGNLPTKIRSFVDTLMSVAVVVFTFPFVLFFLLKDGGKFKRYFIQLIPPKFRKDTHDILEKMNIQVGSYIQGQLIVATCIGVLLFIGYLIIGMDYALVLACIAAVTSVVPYLGPMIAISPAIILALVHSPWMLLKLAVVWMLVQFLEGHFISPNIMGKTMKIHPLTIIFVLLSAGNIAGIFGVILGIPGYAIIKVLVTHTFEKFKQRYNKYYADDAGLYEVYDHPDMKEE